VNTVAWQTEICENSRNKLLTVVMTYIHTIAYSRTDLLSILHVLKTLFKNKILCPPCFPRMSELRPQCWTFLPFIFTQGSLAGWPDWANFRLLGNCLLWAIFKKFQTSPKILCCGFPRYKSCSIFDLEMGWATFWATFFTNSSGHPAADNDWALVFFRRKPEKVND
jgi:hypothetical protein